MKLLKVLCLSLISSFSYLAVSAADYTREDWLIKYEEKYSVRKFDEVKYSTDCEFEDAWHTFLYSKEYPNFIFFEGPICGSLLENFLEISTQYPHAKHLILNSDGGFVETGLQFGQLITKMNFSTVIPSNSECHSSCSIVFMGGVKRYVLGELGLHRMADACGALTDKNNNVPVTLKFLAIKQEETQALVSESIRFLNNSPQGVPIWFLTETLDTACNKMYNVPTHRKLELSNEITDESIYDQIKDVQQEEGSLLELAKFYVGIEKSLGSSSQALTTSLPETAEIEVQYTTGRVRLTCGTGQSLYSLEIEGDFNKDAEEVLFKMTPSDMADNNCAVPSHGLNGIFRNSSISPKMAQIEFPLSGNSKSEFFWHKVFGVSYIIDLKFDFSSGSGIGSNIQLSLY